MCEALARCGLKLLQASHPALFNARHACQLVCTLVLCRRDHITPGMTLRDASTVSGMIWTKPYGDGEQAILQPVVQHYAADFALGSVSKFCFV